MKHNNAHQNTGTRTFLVNAINFNEAMNLAEDMAGDYTFNNDLVEEYNTHDPNTYPSLPQLFQPKEDETTNSMHGYEVEVTRIGCSATNETSEVCSNYFITDCQQNDKLFFYSHTESHKHPIIIKIPLQQFLPTINKTNIQKNNRIVFYRNNLLDYFEQQYDFDGFSEQQLRSSINTTIKTDYEINPQNTYEGLFIRHPNDKQHSFVILAISEQNSNNIIINDNMKTLIKDNQYLNEIITQYKHDLLDKSISPKTTSKKSLKI